MGKITKSAHPGASKRRRRSIGTNLLSLLSEILPRRQVFPSPSDNQKASWHPNDATPSQAHVERRRIAMSERVSSRPIVQHRQRQMGRGSKEMRGHKVASLEGSGKRMYGGPSVRSNEVVVVVPSAYLAHWQPCGAFPIVSCPP